MAYGNQNRTYYKRRRSYRRRKTGGTNWARTARQAWQMGKIAMGLLNTEKKFRDFSTIAAVPAVAGTVIHISNVVQGTSAENRVGDSILLKGLLFRYNAHWNLSGTVDQRHRVILFRWLDDLNGTPPVPNQLLQNIAAGAGILSPIDMDNNQDFKIIFDRVLTLSSQKPTAMIEKWINFGMDKNNMGIRTVGQHATWGTTDGYEKGQVFVLILSSTDTNPSTYDLYTRLRYIDN